MKKKATKEIKARMPSAFATHRSEDSIVVAIAIVAVV